MKKGRTFRVVTTNSTQSIQSRIEPRIVINAPNRAVILTKHPAIGYSPIMPALNHTVQQSDIELSFKRYAAYDAPCIAITHLYFQDLVEETISQLKRIPYRCKFIFTLTVGSSDIPEIRNRLTTVFPDCVILSMINAGKDIGPKMKAIRWLRDNHPNLRYKYLLFMHDKKHGGTATGHAWRRLLYQTLCSDRMFTSGFEILERSNQVKMISASRWVIYSKTHGVMWGGDGGPANQANLRKTCELLGISVPNEFGFVGGTMFWCDFDHFNKFWTNERLDLAIAKMNIETGNIKEPSFTHAIERVFGMMVTSEGHSLIMKI